MTMSFHDGGSSPNITENFWQWLSKAGSKSPHRPAALSTGLETSHLQSLAQSSTDNEGDFSWTYEALFSAVNQLASYLLANGTRPGHCMVCYVSNSVDYVLLFWTSARLGTIFAPVLVASLDDETLTEHYVNSLNPNIVVVQSADAASKIDRHTRSYPDCLKLMMAPKEEHDAVSPSWHHISDAAGSRGPLHALDLPVDATAMILSTSGTTGLPKACPLSNAFIQTEIFQYMSMLDHLWSSDSRLMSLSGSHFAICYLGLCLTACNGASLLMVPRPWPEPEQLLEEMERFDCTHAWVTSTGLYNIACAAEDAPALRPTKLKTILTSGEILHGPKFAFIKEHLKPQTFSSLWGMTEGAPVLGYSKQDLLNTSKGPPLATPGRITAVGRGALPGAMMKIVSLDGSCDNPLPRGEQGMLHVSSQGLIKGYLDGRGADDFYTDADGKQWFKTGDLSVMDADGYIYILGRVKELIHTRQGAVVPTILDGNVQETFNCEALVVSVPDSGGEFSVPVAVLKMPQRRIDSMARQASKRLHSYLGEHYVPVRYIAQERLGLRGQWPTNSSGKFVRGGLQDAVLDFLGQEEETCSSEEQE